jgi:hypothetical protein
MTMKEQHPVDREKQSPALTLDKTTSDVTRVSSCLLRNVTEHDHNRAYHIAVDAATAASNLIEPKQNSGLGKRKLEAAGLDTILVRTRFVIFDID